MFACAFLGFTTRNLYLPVFTDYFWPAFTFAIIQVITMVAMGVYESRVREGYTGMMLRTAVALFLLGSMSCLLYTSPSPRDQRGSRMPSSA